MRSKRKTSTTTRATPAPAAAPTEPIETARLTGEPLGEGHYADLCPRAGGMSARGEEVLSRVRATPPGFVRTYGDVSPGSPRLAGAVLFECDDPSVPWQRIVRADGSLAKGERQRRLLEAEGVPFRGERVDMRVARLSDLL